MGEEGCWRDDDLEVRIWHEINTDIPLPLPSNHDAPELGPALTALRSPAQPPPPAPALLFLGPIVSLR